MIEAVGLHKRFGRFTALDGVSLRVEDGEAVALWGPNGAGKTTLLRCVLGLLSFRGEVRLGGVDIRTRGREARRLLGYVPQELAFYDDFRVSEAAAFFARLRGADRGSCREALASAGLTAHTRKRVGQLSGGMKQRLALGIAMLTDPPILVLDEPTSNLDSSGRIDLLTQLGALRARGKTILFTSHRPEEVRELADRVVMMESGRIVGEERPQEMQCEANTVELRVPGPSLEKALEALRARGFTTSRPDELGPVQCRNGCGCPAPGAGTPASGRSGS